MHKRYLSTELRCAAIAGVAAILLGLLGGCAGPSDKGIDGSVRAEGAQVFGAGESRVADRVERPAGERRQGAPEARAGETGTAGRSSGDRQWSIVLEVFRGADALSEARAEQANVVAKSGFQNVFVEQRPGGAVIAMGAYESRIHPDAQRDIASVRSLTGSDGTLLFPQAFIGPRKFIARGGSNPELDLARAKEIHGKNALYTLQVGVYETPDRTEARQKAEEAAQILRTEGELAFYYHGPTRSMVTVGVFGSLDLDLSTGLMSPELEALRRRHPHNLYNGAGIRQRSAGGGASLQPSGLVQIP